MPNQISVEFDVAAAMRDGVILRANVYRPAADGTYPVLLTRTPYGKDFFPTGLDPVRMAGAGFIVVVQDTRGRFKSDGEWYPLLNEAPDSYDSVEWAATLPGCNGSVGMFGLSYFGFTAWAAAMHNAPHLKALMPVVTWSDAAEGVVYRGGALELGTQASWNLSMGLDIAARRDASNFPQLVQDMGMLIYHINTLRPQGYQSFPLREFAPMKSLPFYQPFFDNLDLLGKPEYTDPISPRTAYSTMNVPSLNLGGWYDIFLQGTLDNYAGMRNKGARLIIGPWSHVNYSGVVGEIDFGFTAQMAFLDAKTDQNTLAARWFGHHLAGQETGILAEAPVKLFVMGDNVWRDEQEWPLARAVNTGYYLHSNGHANTADGDGLLSTEQPSISAESDGYSYDPANPVPTSGGAILMNALYAPGPKDQRPVEARADVLVYSTPPLEQDTEVTGHISVTLWAASSAPDTDWVARLVDVHPDGYAQNLTDGIIRARFRNGYNAPELMQPGTAYEFTIDLWATCNVFKKGHCIRLDITSSNFPRWDRNPNTGSDLFEGSEMRVAQQTILHDAAHPSRIMLPIVPR